MIFAATIFNPNYTLRRSWYLRKFSLFAFGVIGFAYGRKDYENQIVMTMLSMNDYFPVEIKRSL